MCGRHQHNTKSVKVVLYYVIVGILDNSSLIIPIEEDKRLSTLLCGCGTIFNRRFELVN